MTQRKAQESAAQNDGERQGTTTSAERIPEPSQAEVAQAVEIRSALQQRNHAAMQGFVEWCTAKATTTDEDQFNIMASIMGEIMTASNMAELMEEKAPLHARDLVGKPLLLQGFEIREGSYEDSPIGFYAALTCTAPGGEHSRVVTCGAAKVLAKLMMIEHFISDPDREDDYPVVFWFTERVAKSGNHVLDITTPTP